MKTKIHLSKTVFRNRLRLVFTLLMGTALGIPLLGSSATWAESVICFSKSTAPMYAGDEGQWLLSFKAQTSTRIGKPTLKNRADPRYGFSDDVAIADHKFKPNQPRHQEMNRFSGADAWCNYSLLIPKRYPTLVQFYASVFMICEGGSKASFGLTCKQN